MFLNPEEVAYAVVHEIPGRIRFRVPRLAIDPEYAHRLTALTQANANVTDLRVNTTAASIAISYAPGAIANETMRSQLINLIQTASEANILLDLNATSTQQEPEEVERQTNQQPTLENLPNFPQLLETSADKANAASHELSSGTGNHWVEKGSQGLTIEPLTGTALSHRLNVSATTISRRKSKPDFPQWSSSRDPEGMAWKYSKKSQLFVAE